jgi:hypothetical protein
MKQMKGKGAALSLLLALALLPGGAWAGSDGLLRGDVLARGGILAAAGQHGRHSGSMILTRGRPHYRSPGGRGHGFRGHGFRRRGFSHHGFQRGPFFYFGAPGFVPGPGFWPGAIWITGHWQWTDWGWIWVPGHWARRGW